MPGQPAHQARQVGERAGLCSVCGVLAVSVICWAAAEVCGAMGSGRWPDLPLGAGLHIFLDAATDPDRPLRNVAAPLSGAGAPTVAAAAPAAPAAASGAGAWNGPEPSVARWYCMVAVLVGIAGASTALAFRALRRAGDVQRTPRRSAGDARPYGTRRRQRWSEDAGRWATRRDLASLAVARSTRGEPRLTLGRSAGGCLLAAESRHSVMVIGPTQSHKTTGLAVPAILEWPGPVLATSVKSDLLAHSELWRRRKGTTWVFDPAGALPRVTDKWCPLDGCSDWTGARRTAASLVHAGRSGDLKDGDFWYAAAAKLLAPLLLAGAYAGATMSDVVAWVDTQEVKEVDAILKATGCTEALNAAWASWKREDRQLSSIFTTAETVIEPFADPRVGNVARGEGIAVEQLLDGGRNTLYVCSPAHEQARLRPLFTALVEQVVNAVYERATASGSPVSPPLLVVLDEAANIAPIPTLDTLASTGAGQGIQLVTVWQDIAQINARYGAAAASVVNNHRATIVLSGISDPATLDMVSNLTGERTGEVMSWTRDGSGGRSTTRQNTRERLAPASMIRQIPPGEGILLYGHLPPAMITLRPWFEDRELSARARGEEG